MFPRWLAVLWVILGFALGGCFVAAFSQPDQHSHIAAANNSPDAKTDQHQPPKSIGQRLALIWDRTWEEPVAFYTFVLGIFTFCLVVVSFGQGYFLFRADKTTRIAANAADLSARAAIAIELPIIRIAIEHFGFGSGIEDGVSRDSCAIRDLVFFNFGRTKAFPIDVQFGVTVGNELPKIPAYTFTKQFRPGVILDTISTSDVRLSVMEFEHPVPPTIYEDLRLKRTRLWFYCLVAYLDFMETRHEIGMCWERRESFGAGTFRIDPTPAYNRKT